MKKLISIVLIGLLMAVSFTPILAEKPDRKIVIVIFKPNTFDFELVSDVGTVLDFIPNPQLPAVRLSLPEEAIEGLRNNPKIAIVEEDVEISLLKAPPWRKKPKPTPTPTPEPTPTPTPEPTPSPTPTPTPTPSPTPTPTPTPSPSPTPTPTVTPTPTPTPTPEEVEPTWNLIIHNVTETWDEYGWGAYVHIGIIDTGVNYNLPDISINYIGGYDTANWDSDPWDDNGHGTAVTGIILARGDDTYVGVSENIGYHMYKAFNQDGQASLWSLIYAIYYAVQDGVLAINMSWGTPDDNPTLKSYLQWAYDNGVALFGACGNDGGFYCLYPARYDFVFSVGAMDDLYHSPSWANWNADQIAAGVDVPLLWNTGEIEIHSGSSFAVPHSTGLVSFVYSRYMSKYGRLPAPSEVYTAIRNGGFPHPDSVYMDVVCHYGILDVYGTTTGI
jgi:subtilisin family serine protease